MSKIEFIRFKNIELKNNIVIYYINKRKKENNWKENFKKLNIS